MNRRNLFIALVCFLLVVALSFNAVAFEWEGLEDTEESVQTEQKPQAVDKLVLASQNNFAELYYNEATTEVLLNTVDKGSFSSIVSPEYAGVDAESAKNMQELFSFLIYNTKNRSTQSFSSLDEGVILSFKKVDGGFNVQVTKEKLSFLINFKLKNDILAVTVPYPEIKEGDEVLASVTLLPFFGAANGNEDGYIFYPDGSGTLYKFGDKPSVTRSAVTKQIYGDAMTTLDDYMEERERNIMPLSLPVFGVKKGNTAIFAEVTEGAADTSLTLAPSGYVYDLARVYPTFNYRYSYLENTVSGDSMIVFGETSVKSDFTIEYSVLSDGEANWVDMAQRVRKDLFEGSEKAEQPNLSVDLMMTTQKSLLLWDSSRVVTTFEQAQEFLSMLAKNKIDGVRLNLLGWQAGGYNNYPSHMPVSSKAGGIKGLKKLTKAAEKNASSVYLLDSFCEGDFGSSGLSIRRDAAYNIQNKPLADTEKTKLLLDIGVGLDEFKKSIQKLENTGIKGYSFDLFGSLVYDNIASGRALRRKDYINKVNEYLKASNKAFGSSSVDGANLYAIKNAGFIYNLPESSSGEFIYDEDIPFLQVAIHGYRPYSSRGFGNFSNSVEEAALKWLEYGAVPAFVLGEESPAMLKDTKSEGFFYSGISDWTDPISDIYDTFLPAYEKIKDVAISGYESEGKTRIITYENGLKLLINYNREPAEICGVTVGAVSYEFI